MEIAFSILKQIVIFSLVGGAIVVIDSKLIVRLLVFLHPKESRPKREDAKGVAVRQSAEWQFWCACVLSAVLFVWYPADVLECVARILTLWVTFLAARPIVQRWDNRSRFFRTVGDRLTQDAPEIVGQGVHRLVEKTKPAPALTERIRGFFGWLLARKKQLGAEFADIAKEYDLAPEKDKTPGAVPQRPMSPEEQVRQARELVQDYVSGEGTSEKPKKEEGAQ